MKHGISFISIIFVALFLSFSCSSREINKLNGKWIADKEAMVKTLKANPHTSLARESDPDTADALIEKAAERVAGLFVYKIDTDKQEISYGIGGGFTTSKYEILSESNKEIKISEKGKILVITITGPDSISLRGEESDNDVHLNRAK